MYIRVVVNVCTYIYVRIFCIYIRMCVCSTFRVDGENLFASSIVLNTKLIKMTIKKKTRYLFHADLIWQFIWNIQYIKYPISSKSCKIFQRRISFSKLGGTSPVTSHFRINLLITECQKQSPLSQLMLG